MSRPSLLKMSDKVLLSRLHDLVKKEKQTTLAILLHLAEIDRRDLFLAYGFSSLFDYCVGALKYSRSAAGRRIATARCVHRYPEVFDFLESGEVNLSTIGLVAPILNDENKDLILREVRGKSQRQIESIVAHYKPPVAYRDRVRPVQVAVPELGQNSKNRRNPLILNSRCGSSNRTNCGIVDPPNPEGQSREDATTPSACTATESQFPTKPAANRGATKIERRLLIQFLAGEEFMAKLDEVKSLLSNKLPGSTFEEVFEAVMNEFIEHHSPKKREQRRQRRKERSKQSIQPTRKRSKAPATPPRTHDASPEAPSRSEKPSPDKRTRHIPTRLRDQVYVRDSARCTYVGKNGKRCGSTYNLQVDHIKPYAHGGRNTLSNLRLLCGKHNRLEAKRILGEDQMNQYCRRE